jgi:glycosyltransferase involved in cell wall biosynthesis
MTDVHWIFDNRINKEIDTLIKAGYEVHYVAPVDENELKKYVERHPQVHVIPIQRYKNKHERMRKGVREAYRAALSINADIYHFHDPELIRAGIWLKLHGKKVIYDVHENYFANILLKKWISKPLRWIYSFSYLIMEKISLFLFDGIIVVVPDMARRFNKNKTIVLPNYPVLDFFVDLKKTTNDSNGFLFGYLGGISSVRNFNFLLKAFEISHRISKNVKMLLVGPIEDQELKENISKMQNKYPDSFSYISRKPYKEALQIMKNCDAGIIVLKPLPNVLNSSPNKLFEYMALGLPIVASDFPAWHKVLDEAKCTVYVDPLNVNDIAEKMVFLANNPEKAKQMGKRGKKIAFEKYNWEKVEGKLVTLYKKVLQ